LSLQESEQTNLIFYPNPADETITIELKHAGKSNKVTILDLSGRLVIENSIILGKNEISVRDLTPGMYYIRYENRTQKLQIK
jgi:hypothetical protein